MIALPPRSTPLYSSAASDVYKRQGEELAQADRAIEQRPRQRERPPCVRVQPAVWQPEPRTDRAGIRARQQKVGHPADGPRIDGYVGAEEEDEAALAPLEPKVGGTAVAQVLRLRQHGRLRELIRHRGR